MKINVQNVIHNIKITIAKNPEPIKRIGVFGSLVNGNFTDNSDIDIAIEYEPGEAFDFNRFVLFCEMCETIVDDISKTYDRTVDLIHIEDNPRCILNDIADEVVWI